MVDNNIQKATTCFFLCSIRKIILLFLTKYIFPDVNKNPSTISISFKYIGFSKTIYIKLACSKSWVGNFKNMNFTFYDYF